MDRRYSQVNPEPERAVLVGVQGRDEADWQVRESVEELAQLAGTAGAVVVDRLLLKQWPPHAGMFIGTGKAQRVREKVLEHEARVVVFDDDLSPAQGRNLEGILKVKVIDRTQMILDIFAQHARTRAGRLQIELAQYEYLLPRLRRMWTHLERQQGGIGTQGPGEKQLELDRRSIQHRIARLKSELVDVERHREELRKGRRRQGWSVFSLVGYTNAGKSTLINALTGADVLAYDKLFATLDPTTRKIELPNRSPALLTDTVGFIQKLPHHLVESFKATLEEVVQADFLVHVIDAAHPQVDAQIDAVEEVLGDLGLSAKPLLAVLNKMDQPGAEAQARRLSHRFERSVCVSARTGEGLELLRHALADCVSHRQVSLRLRIPPTEGGLIASLRATGGVLEEKYEDDGDLLVAASIPRERSGEFARFQVDGTAWGRGLSLQGDQG